jgi:hypothetical protein
MSFPCYDQGENGDGHMATENSDKIELYRVQTQMKIDELLEEFAQGKINREQFHAVYAHHNAKLKLAEQAQDRGDGVVEMAAGQTYAIRQAHMAKAIGLMIYHNKSGMYVDTIGYFDIPPGRVAPILNDFSEMMQGNRLIDRRIERITDKDWLLFAAGTYTTVVTLFHNEPSQAQSREIERLHHDFEVANHGQLTQSRIDASKLAYPFLVFVQQKLSRENK